MMFIRLRLEAGKRDTSGPRLASGKSGDTLTRAETTRDTSGPHTWQSRPETDHERHFGFTHLAEQT